MRKVAKKFLCLALVVMMIVPLLAFPVNAEEIEPLYTVNFVSKDTGDQNMIALQGGWDGGITVTPNGDSVTLSNLSSGKWANVSAALKDVNLQGNAYTLVFTVTAGDNDEEVGLLLDHQTGFVVNPGKNTFRFTDHRDGGSTFIATTEYEGTGALTQTYAIEIADQGSGTKNGQPIMDLTAYKLYNLTYDESGKIVWNLAYSLTTEQLNPSNFDWGFQGDCDDNLYVRFSRDRKNYSSANSGSLTIKNFMVYKGLVTTDLNLETRAYYLASDGDLLYTANFNGDSTYAVGHAWAGMTTKEVKNGGKTIVLKPTTSNEAAAFGNEMNTTNYPAKGNSYTMTFTVTASDKDQEIGLYPDWSSGYVVIPGKNQFRYNKTLSDRSKNKTIVDYTYYDGTGSLTQTYAIEYKLNDDFSCAEYNLYVAQDGKWVKLYSLDADELDVGPNWSATDYETVIRFYRDSKIENQTGTVAVSNVNVYKGFAAKSGKAEVPYAYDYASAGNGVLLYKANFNGDGIWSVGSGWAGMTTSVKDGGNAIVLTAKQDDTTKDNDSNNDTYRGNVWGKNINDKDYPAGGNSYTVVFTVEASDADEEIGFYPDWSTGFLLTPGQNKLRYLATEDEGKTNTIVVDSTTYEGNGALKQTYAVGFTVDEEYHATEYNLYILQEGVWVCIYSLNEAQMANTSWGGTAKDYEVALRFYRHYYVIDGTGKSTAEVDATQGGTVTVSDLSVYKGINIFPELGLVNGASVRLDNPTGIRFTGSVKKDYLDALKEEYGAENVTIGMLITPTDYLTDNGIAFTKAALDACTAIEGEKYLEIDAKTVLSGNGYYKINCAMVNMNESNYERSFSARLYIKVNGEIIEYSAYNSANNSRSIAEVAERAYNDVKGTQDSVYKYETTLDVGTPVYSPYENREILKDFFAKREQD